MLPAQYLTSGGNGYSDPLERDLDREEESGNPLILQMIREAITVNKTPVMPEVTSLERKLAYTRNVESGKKPGVGRLEINDKGKRPTTGSYHIEQRTFAENIREKEGEEAFKFFRNMNKAEFNKFIHENPDKEEEVAAHLIEKLSNKYGDHLIQDSRGDMVPRWRAAYSHGETGLKRLIRKEESVLNRTKTANISQQIQESLK